MFPGNKLRKTKKLQKTLISTTFVCSLLVSGGVASASSLSTSQIDQSILSVYIDGKLQNFEQPAVLKDGSTLVPLRGIFEKLGATVKWNNATQTVTATKGNTTVVLTIGQSVAYVNGKAVTLTAKAQLVNNATMVPLRFVSEALGANVKWDGNTNTVIITSAGGTVTQPPTQQPDSGQVVNGIKVKYGKHTYGAKSQSEYDKGMAIIEKAIKDKYDSIRFAGGNVYEKYFYEFLDGARWNGNRSDRSERNFGLYAAEGSIGDLVKSGVDKATIEKVYKAGAVAADLLQDKVDPLDGTPNSFTDPLLRGVTDCDSSAQVYSAVFDSLGFNTMIIGNTGHADFIFQTNGKWFGYTGGSFGLVNLDQLMKSGIRIVSDPTFG